MNHKNPLELYEALKLTVVHQEELCRRLSGAYFQYLLYPYNSLKGLHTKAPKILIIGESGCGKTFAVQELARLTDMNFIEINGASLTAEGWQGDLPLSKVLKVHADKINKDFMNIIFIDEFDKMCTNTRDRSGGTDYSFIMQSQLLKLIEQKTLNLTVNKDNKGVEIDFNSVNLDNILYVFAGSFSEVRKKFEKTAPIGFQEGSKVNLKELEIKKELIEYGLLPELVGRITSCIEAKELTKEAFLHILLNEYGHYRINQAALRDLGISFIHDIDKLLTKVYNIAKESKIGARAIQEVIDEEIQEVLFKYPDNIGLIVQYFEYLHKGQQQQEEFVNQQRKRLGI